MKRTLIWGLALAATLVLALPAAAEDELAITIGDQIARVSWSHNWEKRDVEMFGAWDHHDDNGDIVAAGLLVPGLIGQGNRQVDLALGGKLMYVDVFSTDGAVLGLGGNVAYPIPKHPALGLIASAYFAPNVLSFGDIRKYVEFSLGASYHFGDRAGVTLAYRRVDADVEAIAEPAFDDGIHVGFKFRF